MWHGIKTQKTFWGLSALICKRGSYLYLHLIGVLWRLDNMYVKVVCKLKRHNIKYYHSVTLLLITKYCWVLLLLSPSISLSVCIFICTHICIHARDRHTTKLIYFCVQWKQKTVWLSLQGDINFQAFHWLYYSRTKSHGHRNDIYWL